jgi:hypothetical protein
MNIILFDTHNEDDPIEKRVHIILVLLLTCFSGMISLYGVSFWPVLFQIEHNGVELNVAFNPSKNSGLYMHNLP